VRRLLAVLLAAAAVGLAGCGGGNGPSGPESADNIVSVEVDDPRVAAARDTSQRRWPEFLASFRGRTPGVDHAVKVALPNSEGSLEHIWVSVASIRGATIDGSLANDPVGDLGVVYGDPVSVEQAQVEDWAVFRGDELVLGGFSLEAIAAARDGG
jgi:uncharacterized protein YegJ (DUF2314 family)